MLVFHSVGFTTSYLLLFIDRVREKGGVEKWGKLYVHICYLRGQHWRQIKVVWAHWGTLATAGLLLC